MFKVGSESYEQATLVEWLELNNYRFTMIANDTRTPSRKQRHKNTKLGMRPGMSDMIILLKRKSVLFLEMKKKKGKRGGKNGSVESKHQLGWQEAINKIDNCAYEFAYGYEEAIEIINKLEKK